MRKTKVSQEGSTAFHMGGISVHGMGSTLEFISKSEVFSAVQRREVKKRSVQYRMVKWNLKEVSAVL
jgi:hypothetical protein